jgi:EmrB/QacA subfamily drug resistance transporter
MPSSTPSRRLALAVLCAGSLMMILDETIVNVALSSIQDDLGFSPSGLAWVVNAYIVAFGGFLLLAGRIGDLVGRRRVFLAGMAVFTAASLLCGLATTPAVLIAARFAQGIGGALVTAVTLGMIVTLFPEPGAKARAIGAFSFSQAAGGSVGLVVGGAITQAVSWHWVFFVNIPIGVAAGLLAARLLPADPAERPAGGADLVGAALVTGGLMLAVYAIVTTTEHGWASAHTLGFLALAAVLLAGFVARQATVVRPLLPLRIFRSRPVVAANAAFLLMIAGIFGFQFMTALYLQRVLDYEPAQVGVAIVPVAAAIAVMSLGVAPRLIERVGPRATLLPGMALVAAGLAFLARVPADGSYVADVLPALFPLGIGFGLAMPAIAGLAMSAATEADSGLASGLFNTTQQIGAAVGLAVVATLAAARTEALQTAGRPEAEALAGGYHVAYAVGAGLVLASLVVAAVFLRSPEEAADGDEAEAVAPGAEARAA